MSTEPTDAELVRQTIAGDEAAFATLAARYRSRAFGTASRFARGRQELEDLTQDIFLKVWKGLKSFRGDAPFEHWFMRIVVRTCYDFLRKNRKRRENEVLAENSTDYLTRQGEVSPEHRQREAFEIVQRLMSQLNEKDRTIITLLELEERSVREIADLTGWSESNVKVRAHRARKKMKSLYETQMLAES
ncbi:MAG: RNA polymerase sigma factor [Verrucomicrobiales bacterium]|nr:RNA polymerase sigma factor [Verrucomicrobiales bacterium]